MTVKELEKRIKELESQVKELFDLLDTQAQTIRIMLNTINVITIAIGELKNKKKEVEEALSKYVR